MLLLMDVRDVDLELNIHGFILYDEKLFREHLHNQLVVSDSLYYYINARQHRNVYYEFV